MSYVGHVRYLIVGLCAISTQGVDLPPASGQTIGPQIYSVGVAAVEITPTHPVRLNGFLNRKEESAGVRQPIWAKALALGSDDEGPALLITVDILGIPDALGDELARRLADCPGVSRERLTLTATHTHSAPKLAGENPTIFGEPIPEADQAHSEAYTRFFVDKLEEVARAALADRQPATLAFGIGTVGFAQNRRTPGGPVDHDLPVLVVRGIDGQVRALWCSYACHCVTLSDRLISGDWAGYAQAAIESEFPGAIALCSVGCGADANPSSGVTGGDAGVAAAQGTEIAAEVRRLAGGFLAPLHGPLAIRWERVDLPLGPIRTRPQWEQLRAGGGAAGYYAQLQLDRLDRGEHLIDVIEAPVQTWSFGDSFALVFLPGETVVDYSLRLKRELDAGRIAVVGYANAAPGYVPSERILQEGGYEGGDAMVYYDLPGPYAPGLEQLLVDCVHSQLGDAFVARVDPARTRGTAALSPQQAAAAWDTHPELTVQLVAAEPLVVDPVAIDFGPDGRLWVAEMHDYPQGLDGALAPGGRVRLLEDGNGDGIYDRATLFLSGLPFPTGVTAWRNGVLICTAPDILYAEDLDGDRVADEVRPLFTGFGTGNFQARVNSLCLGLDGWVYGSCGLFGGEILSTQTGQRLALGDRDFRMQPDSGAIEPATGRTQQSRVRNDWDDWFGCNNSALLNHYPLADDYLRRNPYLAAPGAEVGVAPSNELFPIIPPLTFKLSGPAGRTTAACGLGIYRDDLLGAEYAGNAFTCEPVSRVVHRLQLHRAGTTFRAERPPSEAAREVLASRDAWCRPVQARTGPDGALWIVDMCRLVIEHPIWIPPEELAQVDPRAGQQQGRIYRVFRKDAPPRPIVNLGALDDEGLVAALDSPNGPQRDLAMHLLWERNATAAAAALRKLAAQADNPAVRVQALATLGGLHALSEKTLRTALADAHPAVVRQAIRLSEPLLAQSSVLRAAVVACGERDEPEVLLQTAYTLAALPVEQAAPLAARLAAAQGEDAYFLAALLSSISPERALAVIRALNAEDQLARQPEFTARLYTLVAASDDPPALAAALALATAPGEHGYAAWQFAAVQAALEQLARSGSPQTTQLPAAVRKQLAALQAAIHELAADAQADLALRLAAIELLGREPAAWEHDAELLAELLAPQQPAEVQAAAIDVLAQSDRPAAAALLLELWKSYSPATRTLTLDALLARAASLEQFLRALEDGAIAVGEIDPARQQLLLNYPDETLRARANALLQTGSRPQRQAVVEQYAIVAQLAGDAERGREAFRKHCSACHRLGEVGQNVGPDLIPLAGKTDEYLTLSVLDPNRALDSRYLNYLALTTDGRTLTGLLSEESAVSVTLIAPDGKHQTLLRTEIEALQSTGMSLMPEGLEKEIPPQTLADIFAWVRASAGLSGAAPKQFAGNAPQPVEPNDDGALLLSAASAAIYGEQIVFEQPFANLGYWHGEHDQAVWQVRAPQAGAYDVYLAYACADESAGNLFRLDSSDATLRGAISGTGGWANYVVLRLGELALTEGEQQLTLRPDGPLRAYALADVHALQLVPAGGACTLTPPVESSAAASTAPAQLDSVAAAAAAILDESLPVEAREAIVTAWLGEAPALVAALAADLPPGEDEYRRIPWIWRVAIGAGRRNQSDNLRGVLLAALPHLDEPLRDWQAVVLGGGIVNGLTQAGVWPHERLPELLLDEDSRARWKRVLAAAVQMADDPRVLSGTRYDALRIVALAEWNSVRAQLLGYLEPGGDYELQMGAVSGLADVPDRAAAQALLAALAHLEGQNRALALSGLVRTTERAELLIAALERGALKPDELDEAAQAALREQPDAELRARARTALGE